MGVLRWIWTAVFGHQDDDAVEVSLYEWLKGIVPWKSAAEIEEEETQLHSELLRYINETTVVNSDSTQDDAEYVAGQTTGCCLRTGKITDIYQESGNIDGNIMFQLAIAPPGLKINDQVSYLAHRVKENEVWTVKKILPLQKESTWDGEEIDYKISPESTEEKEVLYRSELRQVTGRVNRRVIVNNGEFQINLDEVTALFTPVVGDFIYLDAIVEKNEHVADLGGGILAVERIRWLRYRVMVGKVTAMHPNGCGQIGKDVFFLRDACKPGYVPCKGDDVSADAIESYQSTCSWRALLVSPARANSSTIRINTNASLAEVEELCLMKNDITINTEELDFGKLKKGEPGRVVTLELRNNGTEERVLMYGDFHLSRRDCQVKPQRPVEKTTLSPGEQRFYNFISMGKFIGQSRELFVFVFQGFKIGCNFDIEVHDPESLNLLSQDATDKRGQYDQRKGVAHHRSRFVIPGERPILPPKFIANRLESYPIPDRFWNALLNEMKELKTSEEIDEGLMATCPNLKADLHFRNYRDRLHGLLYLEEMDNILKLHQYNMETVLFHRSGPAGEYLCLEVPGLAEKRPSLLVGDTVLASRPWKDDKVIYEGYIHKTLGKSVWLKFDRDFHLGYCQEVFNVEFKMSRTALRRQHQAIELAMRNLGEAILFPKKLSLKPAQVELVDSIDDEKTTADFELKPDGARREIVWFNKNLNDHQKAAVRNVLRGEARPLPYIIFGPPGTGKTVTLVETILQILFLMPDSRLLVATPSNSSANLITERLLDSNLLKPGDLVRLVGYHVLEEGTLPERLRPYSTTGIIKASIGDEARALPIGELQASSNKNTLGRHRITVGTCIALGQLVTMGFPQGHFTHVIVDESGQATEPEILVPLGFLDNTAQAILAGDPLQLGPVIGSKLAQAFGLGESFLERLINRFPYERDSVGFPETGGHDPRLVTQLVDNYRSLPEILALPNSLFYDALLVPHVSPIQGQEADLMKEFAEYLPGRSDKFVGTSPIWFHGIVGKNMQDKDSPSWFNPHETLIALDYLMMSYACGLQPEDIGIITPYRKQVQKMRWYFNRMSVSLPKIGSVEEFQGQERKVIILSAVRSSPQHLVTDLLHSLGFVSSPKRLNVAITRARALLIIIGNPHLLSLDPYWRSTIKYCIEHEGYMGCNPPLNCIPENSGFKLRDEDSVVPDAAVLPEEHEGGDV